MKRKILSVFIAVIIFCSYISYESEASAYDEESYNTAKTVIDGILNEQIFTNDAQSSVTRGEFVGAIMKIFRVNPTKEAAQVYSDVGESSPFYQAVYTASKLEWISKSKEFQPDKNINISEALKITLCAAGYSLIAENSGGYPSGYLSAAKSINLLDDIKTESGELSCSNAYILFYNLLNADTFETTHYGDINRYKKGGRTYLEKLFEMHSFTGIVTGTTYNSLLLNYDIVKNGNIQINGDTYYYGNLSSDMLGKNIMAICKDNVDKPEIVCIIPKKNEEISFYVEDLIGFDSDSVSFHTEGGSSEQKENLDIGYMTIYNGRRVEKIDNNMFNDSKGKVRLLDNNRDGDYDICFIDCYEYGIVDSVDFVNKSIGIKDSGKIDLSSSDSFLDLRLFGGNKIELFEIKKNDVIAIKKSIDGVLINIVVCKDTIYGTVTSIYSEEYKVTIDNTEYSLSDYFIQNELNTLSVGKAALFNLGFENVIVSESNSSSVYNYGYLITIKQKNGVGKNLQMKIFDSGGSMQIYDTAQKLVVDGGSKKVSSTDFYDLYKNISPQLIRFALDSEGCVSQIDLAEDGGEATFGVDKIDANSLVKYSYTSLLSYKSNIQAFPPNFSAAHSIIFKIPTDATVDDDYEIWSINLLTNDSSYSVTAYNINRYGFADAIVIKTSEKGISVNTPSCIIEKITMAVNGEGESVQKLYCWMPGGFKNFLLNPSEVSVKKASGAGLASGDIVRISSDTEGNVKDLTVDFDGSDSIFGPNTSAGGAPFNGGNATLMYQEGGLYSCGDSFIYLSNIKNSEGGYDFSFKNLRNYSLNTKNIAIFNRKEKTVRPIEQKELKTYLGYGTHAQYAVLRQNSYNTTCMFVYE